MLAAFRALWGKKKKKGRQTGTGPQLSWSRMSPHGEAGAAGEGGRCHSTVAMLCAS